MVFLGAGLCSELPTGFVDLLDELLQFGLECERRPMKGGGKITLRDAIDERIQGVALAAQSVNCLGGSGWCLDVPARRLTPIPAQTDDF